MSERARRRARSPKCCCGDSTTPGYCTYRIDDFTRLTVNPPEATLYSFTPGAWSANGEALVCETSGSPIYFKDGGDPAFLAGGFLVNFGDASEVTLHVGGNAVTITKDSDTQVTIDDVTFAVPSLATDPWLSVTWTLAIHLDCEFIPSEEMPYVLDPGNEDCPAYEYPVHFLYVGVGGVPIVASSNDLHWRYEGPNYYYQTEITVADGDFTQYGISADEGVQIDGLNVEFVKGGTNEIQRISFSTENFYQSMWGGIARGDAPDAGTFISFVGNQTYPGYRDDNRDGLQSALDFLYGTGNTEVTIDGDDYLIEWKNDEKYRDVPPLILVNDPFFDLPIEFYDDSFNLIAVDVIFTTDRQGHAGCCSAAYRQCHHICWPDPLPDELFVEIFGPDNTFTPCVADLAAFLACLGACENDCEAFALGSEERCECYNDLSACQCECWFAYDLRAPPDPLPDPNVRCRNTCPGQTFAGMFILPRELDSPANVCRYSYEIPAAPFDKVTGVDSGTNVHGCEPGNFTVPFLLRYEMYIDVFDCALQKLWIIADNISDYPLFQDITPGLGAFDTAARWSAKVGNVMPTVPRVTPSTKLATSHDATCSLRWQNSFTCGEVVANDNPPLMDPIEFCGFEGGPVICVEDPDQEDGAIILGLVDLMEHEWEDIPDVEHGRRCKHCGREMVTRVPADRIRGGVCKPGEPTPGRVFLIRYERPEVTAEERDRAREAAQERRRTYDTMICGKRGGMIGVVPCGKCGGRTRAVEVRACEKHGACTPEAVGRTDSQLVQIGDAKVRPTNCQTCPEWIGPAEWPRKVRPPKDS